MMDLETQPTKTADAVASPASLAIGTARRIVVKVGSSLLVDPAGNGVRDDWLHGLAEDLQALRADGRQLCIVSSGAVALGRDRLRLGRSGRLAEKQAAAAAGQMVLMRAWEAAFAPHDMPTAQLLLTLDDTETRRRWLNARAMLDTLLEHDALPVVNENDSVAADELRYRDNDRLSARVAQMMRADLLILLSDVDGLYSADPVRNPDAVHIPHLASITPDVEALAGDASVTGVGTGGMRTKLAAARIASAAGCATLIASGIADHPLARLRDGARATLVDASGSPLSAYKQWIAGALAPAGTVTVDAGAAEALAAGRSLLPAGAIAVTGDFDRGSCLVVMDDSGREIARGITAYAGGELRAIVGLPSARFEERLGFRGPDELIHRDDMVMAR